ncbi:MAG: PH domain-containing protein [Lachnospiraceae bacterium]|nr:PH domain-containing protein [Lachnospiraceae bacterium]MBQ2115367.1 PH domain-containing protein [Lachnospiraceae bacterium]MBQ2406441.1 PH domain-containing protein [Lachnospiraceae bacterium]MBQ5851697.1 PH domain-containing protein [Lachnospiraceae bacterium]MEE0920227.1 PH domain-containing protein [Lachnospiraceae bacterium]
MEFKERKRILFFGLPLSFTVYTVKEDVITIDKGFFNKLENDCFMYKVQDVTLKRTLIERIFGLGTVICYTSDVTSKELVMKHIKNSSQIKQFILQNSEEQRLKRKVLNTMNIGVDDSDIESEDFT